MSVADCYRENLVEARAALAVAGARMGRFRDQGLVYWGKKTRKDSADYEGWLVKGGIGGPVDVAFSDWVRCEADVSHWMHLLAEEAQTPTSPVRQPARSMTVDEVEARKRELAAQVAARLGEGDSE